MNKGLAKMGFKSDRERTALQKFQDAIKADIQAGMEARGYTRAYMDNHEKHKDTSVWQAEQDKEQAIADKEQAESNLHELGQKITQGKRVLAKQAGEYRQKRSESEQLDSWISAKR